MRKIKQNDEVIILAGKDKGKRGKVLKLVGDEKVLVAGVNMMKRHTKPNPHAGIPGGIVEKEAALHISNVAVINPETNKADRIGINVIDGKKVRVFKSSGNPIDA